VVNALRYLISVAGSNPGSYKQQRVCFFFLKKNTAGAALRSLARTREGREEICELPKWRL
jgi:hypothetical protein